MIQTTFPMRSAKTALPLLLCGATMAQGIVLPPAVTTQNPMPMTLGQLRSDCLMFPVDPVGNLVSRTQLLFDAAHFGAAPATLSELRLRAPEWVNNGTLFGQGSSYSASVRIAIATSPLPIDQASGNFAANLGSQPVTVFSGVLALPDQMTTAWPAVWLPPIVFQQPFAFPGTTAGALTVVVDVQVANIQVAPGVYGAWAVEWTDVDRGSSDRLVAGCELASAPGVQPNAFGAPPVVGQPFTVHYDSYPANSPDLVASVHLLGTDQPTPVLLSQLGFPASSQSCALGVDVLGFAPLDYVPQHGRMVMPAPLQVPANPALVGATFATQPATLEANSSGAWYHTGPAMHWVVGSGNGQPGVAMLSARSTLGIPGIGQLTQGASVSVRFD